MWRQGMKSNTRLPGNTQVQSSLYSILTIHFIKREEVNSPQQWWSLRASENAVDTDSRGGTQVLHCRGDQCSNYSWRNRGELMFNLIHTIPHRTVPSCVHMNNAFPCTCQLRGEKQGHSSSNELRKVAGSIPSQGTWLGCRPGPQMGGMWEATNCFSHIDVPLPFFLSPIPPLWK